MTSADRSAAGLDVTEADTEPVTAPNQAVTLVEGSTFCVGPPSGDLRGDGPEGLFFRDTRIVSDWRLRLDDSPLQPLTVLRQEPFRATFLVRALPRTSRTEVLLERHRYVGEGMREDLRLRNLGNQPLATTLRLLVTSDFADLFAVKEGRVEVHEQPSMRTDGDTLVLGMHEEGVSRGCRVTAAGAVAGHGELAFDVRVPPHGTWETTLLVVPIVGGEDVHPAFPVGRPPEEAHPAQRLRRWRAGSPRVQTEDPQLRMVLAQSLEDLGALRLHDPTHPGEAAVAAGAPWFMALFGRDSLLTSYMTLPVDSGLALGTLQMLARLQGTSVDPRTEEQPGRILHETRLGAEFPLAHGGGNVYYGTVDATPLFAALAGELRRWSIASEQLDALLPAVDRALTWIDEYGDRDGDGFVEYQRSTSAGLVNQGWKDSWDGINTADGAIPPTPIALCEVQGYVYAAYSARSDLAAAAGDEAGARHWSDRAEELKRAFNEQFWLADRGWFAVGLDGDKRPIDALTSNIGHCLWTGIVAEDKAEHVAAHLLSPEMFTGWGVRTLASSMGAYNPMSYHNGSVWPHDSVLVATGLMRYGFVAEAQRIATGLLDAAVAFGGRLPELFCGFDRSEFPTPVPYPTSCSPQAWAAATPIQAVRLLLRLEPRVGEVWFEPAWPDRYGPIRINDVPLAGRRVTLTVDQDGARLEGLPDGVPVVPGFHLNQLRAGPDDRSVR
ncbi:amylo-alpha-1,6-glucosidase [Modestobacter marinus]|uniref:amylo-alpha-1,6-glucosidase n=1 Tax=Modestobacter marinus TaxID=477641 RepID=UPI001C942FDC|nr:glycogen debranching N-terminal domain-containing protein [Modestobacter marinus]